MKTHAQAATVGSPPAASRKARGLFGIACLCVLGLTAFLGSSAPSVGAAESFPGQGFLPDNRAWEMVSPPDKNGGNVIANSSRTRAAADGSAVGFLSLQGFADAIGSGVTFEYIARRTEEPGSNGWSTHAITPLQEPVPLGALTQTVMEAEPRYSGEFSDDLSSGLFKAFSPVPTADDPHPTVAKRYNLYLRRDLTTPGAGNYRLLSDCPACGETILPFVNSDMLWVAGGNAGDASHEPFTNVVYESRRTLTSDATGLGESDESPKLYEGTVEATDEIQTVAVDATAGQFTLEFDGQSTGNLAFDAPATGAGSVEAALNALPSIAPGSVSVAGGPGDAGATKPYVVSFTNGAGIADTDVPLIVAVSGTTPLSGGAGTASVAMRLEGGQHLRLAGRIPSGSATECDDASAPACVGSTSLAGPVNGLLSSSIPGALPLHPISDDGARIVFRAPKSGNRSVYLREDGLRTVKLNASEATVPAPESGHTEYWTASSDGSRIFFSTGETLIDEDTNGSAADLYMYDASKPASAPDNLTLISKGSAAAGSFTGVFGASEDGSYVYFTADQQLIAGEPEVSGAKLYLWHEGTLTYIGSFGPESHLFSDFNAPNHNLVNDENEITSRVAPDGRHLLFMSMDSTGFEGRGGYGGYDHGSSCIFWPNTDQTPGPCRQLFLFSADSGALRCISCSPSGAVTVVAGDGLTNSLALSGGSSRSDLHSSHALSDNGRYVFFQTGERLVADDRNGSQIDVYRYDSLTEEQRLISSGESDGPSYFLDASDDGHDVFLTTKEPLSKWDFDDAYDIYDARVGGGLPEPALAPPSCQGDACQPPPVSLNDPTPSSASFEGRGNETNARKARTRCPKGKRRVKARGGKARCVKRARRGKNNNRRAGR